MNNIVYTIQPFATFIPGATRFGQYDIRSNTREIKIHSVLFDYYLFNVTTNKPIYHSNNEDFLIECYIGKNTSGENIARPAIFNSGTINIGNNAISIRISTPNHYHFNCFYIANDFEVLINATNNSTTDTIQLYASIIIETSETIIF